MNMKLNLASKFCQIAWVVKNIEAAEKYFIETMGVEKFLRMENLSAKDTEGTYLGRPGDWVCNLYIAYAGDTQIELIQPVSGESMFNESLKNMVMPFIMLPIGLMTLSRILLHSTWRQQAIR